MRKKFAGKNVICANFSLPALTSCNRSFRLSVFSFSLPSWVYLCAVLKRERERECVCVCKQSMDKMYANHLVKNVYEIVCVLLC